MDKPGRHFHEPENGDEEMTINLQKPDIRELKPKITVFGVGGAGRGAAFACHQIKPVTGSVLPVTGHV